MSCDIDLGHGFEHRDFDLESVARLFRGSDKGLISLVHLNEIRDDGITFECPKREPLEHYEGAALAKDLWCVAPCAGRRSRYSCPSAAARCGTAPIVREAVGRCCELFGDGVAV